MVQRTFNECLSIILTNTFPDDNQISSMSLRFSDVLFRDFFCAIRHLIFLRNSSFQHLSLRKISLSQLPFIEDTLKLILLAEESTRFAFVIKGIMKK